MLVIIKEKLRAHQQRNHPLPRYRCEHVEQGFMVTARIIRDGVMIEVCRNCYARQDLMKVTMDGKVIEVER